MRKIIIILDGVADIPPKTSLAKAKTPTLDWFAKKSKCGLMYPIKGIAPESGEAQFIILGQSLSKFPGRGPLEALGTGINLKPRQIALRANFAKFKNNKILNRRAKIPSKKIIKKLNKIHKDIKIHPTIQYRAVITINNASPQIQNTDQAYQKIIKNNKLQTYSSAQQVKLQKLKPKGHKQTAEKLNYFITEAEKILKNKTILTRGAGIKPKPVKKLKNWAFIADMPVEFGLAKLLGMKKLKRKNIIKKFLKSKQNIYWQIKETDIHGHLGNIKAKIKAVEKADKLLKPLKKIKNTILCITADHATPYQLKRHSKHPVPYLIYNPNKPIPSTKLKASKQLHYTKSNIKKFTELECRKGKTIEGKQLLKLLK